MVLCMYVCMYVSVTLVACSAVFVLNYSELAGQPNNTAIIKAEHLNCDNKSFGPILPLKQLWIIKQLELIAELFSSLPSIEIRLIQRSQIHSFTSKVAPGSKQGKTSSQLCYSG